MPLPSMLSSPGPTKVTHGTLVVDRLIFTRAIVALNLVTFARLIEAIGCLIFIIAIVVDFSRQTALVVFVLVLVCITLGQGMIRIAVGIVHDRKWAIGAAGALLLLYDIATINWYYTRNNPVGDPVGFVSGIAYLNVPFVAYLISIALNKTKK